MFDLIGGTSIGGIIAIALSCGISARMIRKAIEDNRVLVFQRRHILAGWIGGRYKSRGLRTVINAILGDDALRSLSEIDVALFVVTVEQGNGLTKILRSKGLDRKSNNHIPLLDAALATSAAPTYFPAHTYNGRSYVDGGLAANSPALVAVTEATRNLGARLNDLHMVSIGTAGMPYTGRPGGPGSSGRLSWLVRHNLFSLTARAQESLVSNQIQELLRDRCMHIDAVPPRPIAMDDTSPPAVENLVRLAEDSVSALRSGSGSKWRYFLSHRAKRPS